ncbi:sugar ABC transporter ATP-binding protein [Sporofaciens musculi]|uniref:sugar ABC transporter ATP-binding protein n=1 Tax=Sporofaciens musculi TaxID=2681861 RepID=UPI00257071FB|nr:sugar ABC transporter ATP-binding protein [Sporofaciens musculi]
METPVLKVTGINKSFSGHRVLKNINLTLAPGERLCLVGENGCGKSTLIKIISGVYKADSGQIELNGHAYTELLPTISIKEGVQVIYQDFSVFPNLTVAENISLGTQLVEGKRLVNWKRIKKEAADALKEIGVEMDLEQEVRYLSVAQKQIVAISRAILQKARLIIMDEPTTALTQKEIERLYEIIYGLSEKGISVIFVSHKLDEVFTVCQRIAVIRNGNMIVDKRADEFEKERLVYYMTGQEIEEDSFSYEAEEERTVLEAEHWTQEGSFEDISFHLRAGEILGITGQLGSGRTELAKALFGIGKIDTGTLKIHGEEKHLKNIRTAMENRIAYVPEDRLTEGLFMERSLTDNINAAVLDQKKKKNGWLDDAGMRAEAKERIRELSINASGPEVPAGTFSGGNQQRVVIARWLATNPEILILNGPSVGVDVKSKSEIHRILKELARNGLAVVLISDDIGELLSTTNRIIVMNSGRMVYENMTEQITADILNEKITQNIEKKGGMENVENKDK